MTGAPGVEARPHIPVMLPEVLEAVAPLEGALVVDATFGAGGYTKGFLDAGARVIAFDRDPDAIEAGQGLVAQYGDALTLVHARFSELEAQLSALGVADVDAVVLDIGVSSMQLDQAHRGFAFRHDGPLDMRMAQSGLSASDIINNWSAEDLANLFYVYGEERRSRAIARLVCDVRQEWPITTTRGLATLIEKLMPVKRRASGPSIHPATRVFQALRIAVNDELGELVAALAAAEAVIKPGGRLAVVTFHSLEDRIVKRFFTDAQEKARGSRHQPDLPTEPARFTVTRRRPSVPSDEEMQSNPRARSAKLRVGVRTSAAAAPRVDLSEWGHTALGLPKLGGKSPRKGGQDARP